MKRWRERVQPLDLSSERYHENAVRLTQARRRMFNDLIGIRVMRKISQAQVARAIGIDRSGVSRFEADIETSNPTVDVILRYAHAVGASIDIRVETIEDSEKRVAQGSVRHFVRKLDADSSEAVWQTDLPRGVSGKSVDGPSALFGNYSAWTPIPTQAGAH